MNWVDCVLAPGEIVLNWKKASETELKFTVGIPQLPGGSGQCITEPGVYSIISSSVADCPVHFGRRRVRGFYGEQTVFGPLNLGAPGALRPGDGPRRKPR